MRRITLSLAIALLIQFTPSGKLTSQVLDVPQVIQEQSQWCWVGVSKCVLDFFGYPKQQCEIAEYARSVITWYNFGTTNCCSNPNAGCNYWNYNWGRMGSIEDILKYFGGIVTQNLGRTLTLEEIKAQIDLGQPFIFRWGWKSGGGHFLVGHGLSGSTIYYMDPWYNSGHRIADYQWVVENTDHNWTHTQYCVPPATSSEIEMELPKAITAYPNPASNRVSVKIDGLKPDSYTLSITSTTGKELISKSVVINMPGFEDDIDISSLASGVYIVHIYSKGFERFGRFVKQ
jgi:hypothetical protein